MKASLEDYRDKTYDFKLEASMMLAVSELVLGNIEKSREVLRDILELDLDLTNQHFHDVRYYYLNRLLWSNIIMSTFEIKGFEWNSDPSLLAVYGFLNFKNGNTQEGREHIDRALLLDQNNYKIKNLLAYIQNKSNRKENACETLGSVTKHELSYLRILLRERLCVDENNIEDRKTLLASLQLSNHFRLQVLTSLAWVNEKEQNRPAAKGYFKQAQDQDLSKNYIPLLLLRAKLENISTN